MNKFLLIMLTIMLTGCESPDESISTKISAQFDNSSSDIIDLREVTPVEWDRFCAIGPYAHNDTTEKVIGFKWNSFLNSNIGGDDSIYLLLFIKENSVVTYTEHPRGKGDFEEMEPRCLPKNQSVLHKIKDNQYNWVSLVTTEQVTQ